MSNTNDNTPMALAPEQSPLDEANPESLNELLGERINKIFNMKPLDLRDNDLADIVKYYRNERLRFLQEEQRKAAEGPKTARRKVPKSVAEAIQASIDLI